MTHPFLFPAGKFGYHIEGEVKLTPSKYFNQRLISYEKAFVSESKYIFIFAHSVYQKMNMTGHIAMQKVCLNQIISPKTDWLEKAANEPHSLTPDSMKAWQLFDQSACLNH